MRTFDFSGTNDNRITEVSRVWWENKYSFGFLKLTLFLLVAAVYPVYLLSLPPNDATPVAGGTYDLQNIMNEVGAVVILPADEDATITQLEDIGSYRTQLFFSRVLVDDILIVYKKNGIAILFDPVSNKIINMSLAEGSPANAAPKDASPLSWPSVLHL